MSDADTTGPLEPAEGIDHGVTTAYAAHYPEGTRVWAVRHNTRIFLGSVLPGDSADARWYGGIDPDAGRKCITLPPLPGGWLIETAPAYDPGAMRAPAYDGSEDDDHPDPDGADEAAARYARRFTQ